MGYLERATTVAPAQRRHNAAALDRPLPAWLDWGTRAAICLVAGLLVAGMPLAMVGAYRPPVAIPLALLAAAGLLWPARPAATGPGVAPLPPGGPARAPGRA